MIIVRSKMEFFIDYILPLLLIALLIAVFSEQKKDL